MTYCVGLRTRSGLVLASDSRTHAGVDDFASFCKMELFERPGDRVLVILCAGNLAATQAIVEILRQRCDAEAAECLWHAGSMVDAAAMVSEAMREVGRRDGPYLDALGVRHSASFILGGQIGAEPPRLFRIYAESNFIEAGDRTLCVQSGETKYGKPIIDWVVTHETSLDDAAKCVLLSFDATMRSNLSVGMPIDLLCYRIGDLSVRMRRRFEAGDAYFDALSAQWSESTRAAFRRLPDLCWTTDP